MSDELLTAQEVAARLKFSVDGFYRWRRSHHVESAIEGRVLRFRWADVLRARERETQPTIINFAEAGRRHARGGRGA